MYVWYGADTVREVLELAAIGFSKMEISRRVGVNPKTVRRWVAATGPTRARRAVRRALVRASKQRR